MDTNNPTSENINTNLPPIPPKEIPTELSTQTLNKSKTSQRKNKHFSILVIIMLFLIVLLAGGIITLLLNRPKVNSQNNTQTIGQTTTSTTPTPTRTAEKPDLNNQNAEIISVDDDTSKYVNKKYGFSVTYPKQNRSPSNCTEWYKGTLGVISLAVFEDPLTNTIYISSMTMPKPMYKETDSYGNYEYIENSCKYVKNSLELIKHGYESGIPDPNDLGQNIRKPNSFQLSYDKIASDDDLLTLAQSMPYGTGCQIGSMNLTDSSNDTYQITLVDSSGENGIPESSCHLNFGYYFLYSKTNNVAIITSGYQEAIFNGTNGQYEPNIEFLAQ